MSSAEGSRSDRNDTAPDDIAQPPLEASSDQQVKIEDVSGKNGHAAEAGSSSLVESEHEGREGQKSAVVLAKGEDAAVSAQKEGTTYSATVEEEAGTRLAQLSMADDEPSTSGSMQDSVDKEPNASQAAILSPQDTANVSTPIYAPQGPDDQPEWNEKEPSEDQRLRAASPRPENDFDEKQRGGEAAEPRPEIDHIVQQFGNGQGVDLNATSSPQRSELPIFHYPPRSSSLENASQISSPQSPDALPQSSASSIASPKSKDAASISSQPAPAPPEPDPEPALPFDFHRFLEQLRHRTADPVAKFLRSFLLEFSKKQWQVHEQVKIISDFLIFISGKMMACEVWRNVSDAEFDNAREGMEKLVMNRLYNQTFSPEIPGQEVSPAKGRRKGTPGPGRKGQHQEDVERDEVLAQKIRIYRWLREEHLDMQPFGDKGRKFLTLAQQELSKIRSYRAPRDKIICVLNTCKVLFGYLRSSHNKDQSADAFIPLLIWTVLKANPEHLVSNVQYILRFRNQEKLNGEAGYYMSSLMGAVQFIENLDRTNLTITDDEFEANVEQAVSSFQEPHLAEQQAEEKVKLPPQHSAHPSFNEKATLAHPEVTPRHSMEGERSSPRKGPSRSTDTSGTDETDSDDNAAVVGLLRTIQKPLSTIGRIFTEDASSSEKSTARPLSTPQRGSSPRPPRVSSMLPPTSNGTSPQPPQPNPQPPGAGNLAPGALAAANRTNHLSAGESAARQASAEAAQAQEVTRAEHRTVVE